MAFKSEEAKAIKKEQDEVFERILKKAEARETINGMLKIKTSGDVWRGVVATPPGSGLEKILSSFNVESPIPLEIPLFTYLHFVSGYLLSKQVKMTGDVGTLYPDLWTIVLSESGAGKSFVHSAIAKGAPVKSEFPDCGSGAKFIEAFKEHNFGIWFQDEIAQKMKLIETPNSPVCEIKEYLLKAYSYDKIERSTIKGGTVTIENPCIGILGLNTPESFFKAISEESMLDGFAQRFSYVIAQNDPKRSTATDPYRHALFNKRKIEENAKEAFADLLNLKIHPIYYLDDEAETAFRSSFSFLYSQEIPESFFRRIMFKAFKYAMLYHIILLKETDHIDAEDIGWGARVCTLHLNDIDKLLSRNIDGQKNDSVYEKIKHVVGKAQKLNLKYKAEGTVMTYRMLQQGIAGGLTAEVAKLIMQML